MSEENRIGKAKLNRRDVVTTSAAGAAAVVAAAGAAAAQTFQVQHGATQQMGASRLNKEAKAILPDGSLADRGAILTKLGLNPNTPRDAWLAIVNCGRNASALTSQQLDSVRPQLQQKGIIIKNPQ